MDNAPFPASWPEALTDFLLSNYGPPLSRNRLGGMSGAGVWRVRWAQLSLVVKAAKLTELRFYQQVAPLMANIGVAVPLMYWHHQHWLVLEDVPRPLPQQGATVAMLDTLRRLHSAALAEPPDWPLYQPAWPTAMTYAALSQLPSKIDGTWGSTLFDLQEMAQPLFAPSVYISGDPNPLNWGVKDDGTVVLFDWERFSRASAAIDLAITIPGLGSKTAYNLVAATYLGLPSDAEAVRDLAVQIAIAKVWVLIEFLSMAAAGHVKIPANDLAALVAQIPSWLVHILLIVYS